MCLQFSPGSSVSLMSELCRIHYRWVSQFRCSGRRSMSEPYLCCLAFYFSIFYLKKTCFSLWRAALFLNCFSVGWPVFSRSLSSLKYNATEGCLPCDVQSTTYISLKNFLMTTSCTLPFSQRKKVYSWRTLVGQLTSASHHRCFHRVSVSGTWDCSCTLSFA